MAMGVMLVMLFVPLVCGCEKRRRLGDLRSVTADTRSRDIVCGTIAREEADAMVEQDLSCRL